MIRKLILPALAALLLAGCASYQYRGGTSGDYYYGQPGTDYRYYGYPSYGYGGYGYGYPSYFSYRSYFGYPYGYGGYYRPPYKGPHHGHGHGGNHSGGNDPGQGQNPPAAGNDSQDRPTAPWRDLERLRERARAHDRVRASSAEPSAAPYRRVTPQQSSPAPQRSNPVRQRSNAVPQRSNPVRSRASEVRSIRKRDRGPITEL